MVDPRLTCYERHCFDNYNEMVQAGGQLVGVRVKFNGSMKGRDFEDWPRSSLHARSAWNLCRMLDYLLVIRGLSTSLHTTMLYLFYSKKYMFVSRHRRACA